MNKQIYCHMFLAFSMGFFLSSCGNQALDEPQVLQQDTPSEPVVTQKEVTNQENEIIIADWAGGSLSLSQIDKFIDPKTFTSNPAVNSASTIEKAVANQRMTITQTLVGNYLLLQEARAMKITLTPAEQEAVLHKAKGNFESEEVYAKYLENASQSEEDFINVLANIELGRKCVSQKEDEIWNSLDENKKRNYYNVHIHDFTPPHRSFFNRIDIHIKDERTAAEAKSHAEKLHAEIAQKIKDANTLEEKRDVMREYARNESDSFEASYNGGYVTMYHTPQFEEAFSSECMQAAKDTGVGELSPVYRSKHGYGFLLVKVQHPSFVHPFESETIQSMLPNMILEKEMIKWRDELKEKYKLKIYDEHFYDEYPLKPIAQTADVSSP